MESGRLSSTEQALIRESWQKVSSNLLQHGIVLFTSLQTQAETWPLGRGSTNSRINPRTEEKVYGREHLKTQLAASSKLFDLDPDLLPLFQYNCRRFSSPQECLSSPEFLDHIRKVMLVIDAAVTHLENLPSLEEYLTNLGKKHQAVGVKVDSFSVVGESLLFMLEKCLGTAFSTDMRGAWTRLYGAVVKAMSRGWDARKEGE